MASEEAEVVQLREEAEGADLAGRSAYTQRRDESASNAGASGMAYAEEAMRILSARDGATALAQKAIVFVAVGLAVQDGERAVSGGQISHALAALELDTVVRVARKWSRGRPKFWEFTPE